ncbi:hypothetical protein RFI_36860 [Reticulomyxa filosa]|uniref:Calcineurin-like phosphoesterase domain-containing protein n=1 Tax=Reticulomyxa filosa TaxID=46433 RepID=X6LIP6_RETFI|nr:hypothetical protein RFI_36860 [Reticulomyxa filosa]|eukprot:ETO00580.1 hypothetical protein RFI_36860 [Reticulomyxa filosa]
MVSVGNHEKFDNFTSFRHRFFVPPSLTQLSPRQQFFYYSYNVGRLHVISMCTEQYVYDYSPGSAQYQWLVNDLQTINRTETPCVLIIGHRPMYSSDLGTDSGPLQLYIEPLLHQYRVDLAIWGHMHCYERTYPVYNNTVAIDTTDPSSFRYYQQPNATVHFTIGTAGAVIDEQFQEPPPSWSAFRNGTLLESPYGFGVLKIYNDTHLYLEFRTIEGHGNVMDYVWIVK